jgi:hypothetical protein
MPMQSTKVFTQPGGGTRQCGTGGPRFVETKQRCNIALHWCAPRSTTQRLQPRIKHRDTALHATHAIVWLSARAFSNIPPPPPPRPSTPSLPHLNASEVSPRRRSLHRLAGATGVPPEAAVPQGATPPRPPRCHPDRPMRSTTA